MAGVEPLELARQDAAARGAGDDAAGDAGAQRRDRALRHRPRGLAGGDKTDARRGLQRTCEGGACERERLYRGNGGAQDGDRISAEVIESVIQ
jgi:hypothetical protein